MAAIVNDPPNREAWNMKTIGRKALTLKLNVTESDSNALLWFESKTEKDDNDSDTTSKEIYTRTTPALNTSSNKEDDEIYFHKSPELLQFVQENIDKHAVRAVLYTKPAGLEARQRMLQKKLDDKHKNRRRQRCLLTCGLFESMECCCRSQLDTKRAADDLEHEEDFVDEMEKCYSDKLDSKMYNITVAEEKA